MKVVLDTNILVQAAWRSDDQPDLIFSAWLDRAFDLIISPALRNELEDVLARERIRMRTRWTSEEWTRYFSRLDQNAEFVDPPMTLHVVRDDDDNRVIEAAIAGEADYIVTRDEDLLTLAEYGGVRIVSPASFIVILREMPS